VGPGAICPASPSGTVSLVKRSTRQVLLADHLWEVYGRMAEEMGTDRDGLLNEAMHAYARLHGFVVPGDPAKVGARPARPPERVAEAERVLVVADRLERDISERASPSAGALRLESGDGAVSEVAKDRFLIGRGGHCDLVIDSPKISREHAALVRTEDGWWIEDLGSSNGTWFRGERIERRKVEHGDEYFLSAERLRCALR